MADNRRSILGIALLLAGAALIVWLLDREASGPEMPPEAPVGQEGETEPGVEDGEAITEDAPSLVARGRAPEPPADAGPETNDASLFWLEGRVLDDRRHPVAGARVVLSAPYANRFDVETTTGVDGRYTLRGLDLPPTWSMVTIRALSSTHAGSAHATVGESTRGEVLVPDIVLLPGHPMQIEVVRPDGTAAAGSGVVVLWGTGWTYAPILRTQADDGGLVRFDAVPEGTYRVVAALPGFGRGATIRTLPGRVRGPIRVTLTEARSLAVTVVDKTTKDPIQGAHLHVFEHLQVGQSQTLIEYEPKPEGLQTDARGEATLADLGADDRIQVVAQADGYNHRQGVRVMTSLAPSVTEHTIELAKLRTVRFPLAKNDPLAPPDGAVLRVEAAPGTMMMGGLPSVVRVEGAFLVAEGCPPAHFHMLVFTEDGAYARMFAAPDKDPTEAVTFTTPARITVIVKHADGRPATGSFISVRNQGNNVMLPPQAVDAEGTTIITLPYEHLVDLYLASTKSPYGGTRIASVDPKKTPETTVEATAPSLRRVELTFTIDGALRLPPSFSIAGAMDLEEDPTAGTVTFGLAGDPAKPRSVSVTAPGFLPENVSLPAAPDEAMQRAAVTLARGGRILLKVKMPEDGAATLQVGAPGAPMRGIPMGRGHVKQEELGDEDGWRWIRFSPLRPGSFEARDTQSGARSDPVDVEEGREHTLELDLSGVGFVEGRVEVPDGYMAWHAKVLTQDDTAGPGGHLRSRARITKEGTFRLRIPGNRPTTLRVEHPKLIPFGDRGEFTVQGPAQGVVLQLIEGARVEFTLDPPLTEIRRRQLPAVHLWVLGPPDDDGEVPVLQRIQCSRENDVWLAEGLTPGTHRLRIDARHRAPIDLGMTTVTRETKLGRIEALKGATIRIVIKVPEGEAPGRIFASAWMEGTPRYSRFINSRGETEVLLPGLGKGRFNVSVSAVLGGGRRMLKETVESDGESEIVLELDMTKSR